MCCGYMCGVGIVCLFVHVFLHVCTCIIQVVCSILTWYLARRKSAWYTLMRFWLIKNCVAPLMTFTLFRGVCSDKISVSQLAKMALVCCLCGSSVAYSLHRVALFGKKASQESLTSQKCSSVGNVER